MRGLYLPVPRVRTLAKSSSLSFLDVLEASLGAPGAITPLMACVLSRVRLAPAWPTVAGTCATVAAILGSLTGRSFGSVRGVSYSCVCMLGGGVGVSVFVRRVKERPV